METYEGDFLFTHFGFSGPVVLDISRHWIRKHTGKHAKVVASFLPQVGEDDFRKALMDMTSKKPSLSIVKFLSAYLPARFAEMILKKVGMRSETVLNQLPRPARESLLHLLKHCPLNVTGDRGYAKAEVTAGGVPLTEVDPATLESRKQKGLFFAGEILDVDGRIGGFN